MHIVCPTNLTKDQDLLYFGFILSHAGPILIFERWPTQISLSYSFTANSCLESSESTPPNVRELPYTVAYSNFSFISLNCYRQSSLFGINPAQHKRVALYDDPAQISLSYPSPPVLIA
ncbi:hypothetical protein GBA52_022550 [Prunus armeniaca]|nr:hypothetical protein GBA52_022550 [Prunus armeniaca]